MPAKPIDGVEYRYLTTQVELRNDTDGPRRLEGHAAVVETDTFIGPPDDPYWIERIQRGAFDEVLNDPNTAALFNHNPDYVLGRVGAGTLTLREDQIGLFSVIIPPDTQAGRDMLVSVERRDVTQMSFGFTVKTGGQMWEELADGKIRRTITKIGKLYDVSPVTFAAFPSTDIAVREAREAGAIVRTLAETEIRNVQDSLQRLRNRLALASI